VRCVASALQVTGITADARRKGVWIHERCPLVKLSSGAQAGRAGVAKAADTPRHQSAVFRSHSMQRARRAPYWVLVNWLEIDEAVISRGASAPLPLLRVESIYSSHGLPALRGHLAPPRPRVSLTCAPCRVHRVRDSAITPLAHTEGAHLASKASLELLCTPYLIAWLHGRHRTPQPR
jgi:hypothetical protein